MQIVDDWRIVWDGEWKCTRAVNCDTQDEVEAYERAIVAIEAAGWIDFHVKTPRKWLYAAVSREMEGKEWPPMPLPPSR